jgi:hypothetical protein
MSSHHHLSAGVGTARERSSTMGWEYLLMRHRRSLAISGSVGVGGYACARFLLAGAPVAESLGAAAIIGLALLLYCAVRFRLMD